MRTLNQQLVFCKREDWQIALLDGVAFSGDSLELLPGRTGGYACLCAIDSGEKGFLWGRLTLTCELKQDSMLLMHAYAADVRQYGDYKQLDSYLASLAPGSPDTRAALGGLYRPVGRGDDCYIGQAGRYLWLMIEWASSGGPLRLDALRLSIKGDHMMDYLPAIYHKEGDFTRRFLSIFDSIVMDMERGIYELPALFDFESAPADMLGCLAEWMCVDTEGQSREQVIAALRTARRDYEELYTPGGICRQVRRLTGKEPILIESADVDPNAPGCVHSELYRRLYGENPYRFFLLMAEDIFESRAQMELFLERMQTLIPAGTEFELVLLKRCVQLDRHTYLGINAFVSDFVPVVIDENTTIHYDTMIGGNVN